MWRECVSHYTGNQLTLFFFFINIITVSFKDCILWLLISYCDRHLKHKYPNAHTVVAIVIGLQVCVCVCVCLCSDMQWVLFFYGILTTTMHFQLEIILKCVSLWFMSTLTVLYVIDMTVLWQRMCRRSPVWSDVCPVDGAVAPQMLNSTMGQTHTHTHTHVWQSCIWIWVSQVFTLSRCVWLS